MSLFGNSDFLEIIARHFNYQIIKQTINGTEVKLCMSTRLFIKSIHAYPLGMYFPILDNVSVVNYKGFIEEVKRTANGQITITIDPRDPAAGQMSKVLYESGFLCTQHRTHILHLGIKLHEIQERFNQATRYEAKKTTSEATEVLEGNNEVDFANYYEIYLDSTKRWGLERPIYSKSFICDLHKVKNLKLWLFLVDGKPISGMIVFVDRDQAFYWQGATLLEDKYKKIYPAKKLLVFVINKLNEQGVVWFNLGASTGLSGVRQYKEGFGAVEVTYPQFIFESPMFRWLKTIYGWMQNK